MVAGTVVAMSSFGMLIGKYNDYIVALSPSSRVTVWTSRPSLRAKRALDLALTLVAGLPLLAIAAIVAGAIRVRLGSPVLFRQQRPGYAGAVFTMFKFRTMTDARGPSGELLPDAERLTRFGHWLRSTSLDELPELINVLRGEMSLVGPRPLLVEYLAAYTPEQARRHEVPPGITGWAQIHGRNAIDWERVFALDVWYVDHRSLVLDVRILLRTVAAVLGRRGVNEPGEATRRRFARDREGG